MYIRDMSCISTQDTYNDALFEEGVKVFDTKLYWAIEPKLKGIVPMNLLRRMSKAVRMGVGAGLPLIDKYKDIEGIIIGSANGSIEKSISFLNQIVEYGEGTLTPTNFIQSTSNSIAGTLALMGKIRGYNNTHVNQGISFESAILDALLLFSEGKTKQLLLGGVEEISQANFNVDSQRGLFKEEDVLSSELLQAQTKGTVSGEGAALFVVDAEKTDEAIAEIVDVDMIFAPSKEEVVEKVNRLLSRNGMTTDAIDAVFMGRNGDVRTDFYYDYLQEKCFPNQGIYVYKNLTGDYYTVAAFATWLATKLLNGTTLPKETIWKAPQQPPKNILVYNHYEGTQHGFTLLRQP